MGGAGYVASTCLTLPAVALPSRTLRPCFTASTACSVSPVRSQDSELARLRPCSPCWAPETGVAVFPRYAEHAPSLAGDSWRAALSLACGRALAPAWRSPALRPLAAVTRDRRGTGVREAAASLALPALDGVCRQPQRSAAQWRRAQPARTVLPPWGYVAVTLRSACMRTVSAAVHRATSGAVRVPRSPVF